MEKLKAPSRIQRILQPSKSREILDLLAIEQEKAIQREEDYLIALIQESKEFHPQWDMWLIKNMYKEHQRLVEAESAFITKIKELLPELIQQYPRFAPFLMTLWIALGVFNDDEWAEGMEEWLTQVLNNVTILKQIWLDTEGIWWVRKHLEWWVEKILDAIQALENTLEKINAMKHPDEVTKQFLENLKKHKTPGSMWIDNLVLSEKAQALIQEYKQIYDQQQNNKELLIEDCEEWWKQIVKIVIEQSGNEWVAVSSLQNEWTKLSWVNIKTITDEALEELNDEVHMFEQKIEMKWKQKFVFIKKQIDTMNRVTQAEKWVILRWKEKHKYLFGGIWNEWNIIRQRQIDQLNVLFAQVNEGKMIIEQEKKERVFEKLRLKWENIIQEILVAYEGIQSKHEKNEKFAEVKKVLNNIKIKTSWWAVLWANDYVHNTINEWLLIIIKDLEEFKKSKNFINRCEERLLVDIYPNDKDPHHILIKKGLLTCSTEELEKETPRSFAQQEQEGKSVEEFEFVSISPHVEYRQDMVSYAKENDIDYTERFEKRAERVEELRIKWLIKEDADGVSFGGLKIASKAVQEKALNDAFGDKLQNWLWRHDHQWNSKRWTKKVLKKDINAYGNKFGDWELASILQLDTMRKRIRNNFDDVWNQDDELYILQMINPDLFESMWLHDVEWLYRSYIEFGCDLRDRFIDEDIVFIKKGGLFLVQQY